MAEGQVWIQAPRGTVPGSISRLEGWAWTTLGGEGIGLGPNRAGIGELCFGWGAMEMAGWSRVLSGWVTQWGWPRKADGFGGDVGDPVCKVGVPRPHTYLAKAVQGLRARVPTFVDTHGCGRKGVFPLQQHADIAPGQSWGRAKERL